MKHKAYCLNLSDELIRILSNYDIADTNRNNVSVNVYDLKKYLQPNGNISGEILSQTLFPAVSTNYFISHSHDNTKIAKVIACCIENVGESVFLDETLWQSADKLIKVLNSEQGVKKCKCGNEYYDLDSCLRNASMSYVLLSAALQEVISKAHTFIFIGTKDSIYSKFNCTSLSPWLYYEIKTINQYINSEGNIKLAHEEQKPKIELPLEMDNFVTYNLESEDDLCQYLSEILGKK